MTPSDLDGILPPITTPFTREGELDLAALEHNLELYNRTALRGYVVFGSNGEAVHLDAAERRRTLAAVRRGAAPGKIVVAGINELSSRAAIFAVREAAEEGADAALVITPYFYKKAMNQEVLRAFFLEVADASALPLLVYHVPQNTGVALEPPTLAALAEHDRILGAKDSSGNQAALAETVRLSPPGFRLLVGNAGILYPALMTGATGAILAVACVAPGATIELADAVSSGDFEGARRLQERLAPLAHSVTAGYGVAGLKAALDAAGFLGGEPRRPLLPLGTPERRRLLEVMRSSGFFATLQEI